jgi:hypothetical protein
MTERRHPGESLAANGGHPDLKNEAAILASKMKLSS